MSKSLFDYSIANAKIEAVYSESSDRFTGRLDSVKLEQARQVVFGDYVYTILLAFASHSECLNSFKNAYLPVPGLAHIEASRGVCSHPTAEETLML